MTLQAARIRKEESMRALQEPSAGVQVSGNLKVDASFLAKGWLVALDAEFVAQVSESAEIDEEGNKRVLQDSCLALARCVDFSPLKLCWLVYIYRLL